MPQDTSNTMPNHEKTHFFHVFRVVADIICGKMVPVLFQTEAHVLEIYLCSQYHGMMEAEKISKMLGWATVQT
jgi:hypothetical protein